MKSVLVSTDFVKDNDGNFRALEINTNTAISIQLENRPLTTSSFEENLDGYFNHVEFNQFCIDNSFTKIILIEGVSTSNSQYFKVFCEKYGLNFELVSVDTNQLTVPDIPDDDDTLIIRVAYDTYALIDDLYARDMFEFHNLIASESFAPVVSFNDFDQISELKEPLEEEFPNYMLKPRTPGYNKYDYPQLYRFESEEQLNAKKLSLGDDEFLSEYYICTSSIAENEGRTSEYRSVNLIYGDQLDTLNLFNYEKINSVSVYSDALRYGDNETDGKLNRLLASKFVPLEILLKSNHYHFDDFDNALNADNNLINFSQIEVGTNLKSIVYTNDLFETVEESLLNQFNLETSSVELFETQKEEVLFVNITAENPEYGIFEWFDGGHNRYFAENNDDGIIQFVVAQDLKVGDEIYTFNSQENTHVKFNVTDIFFDIKDISTHKLTLSDSPLFFIEITNDNYTTGNSPLFLIQHNVGCEPDCYSGYGLTCGNVTCYNCGKNSDGCLQCGGSAVTTC